MYVRGKSFEFNADIVANILGRERPLVCDYPQDKCYASIPIDFNLIAYTLLGAPYNWIPGVSLSHRSLIAPYRILNLIVSHNVTLTLHFSDVSYDQGYFLYAISQNLSIDFSDTPYI